MLTTEDDYDEDFEHWYKQASDPSFITKRDHELMVTRFASRANQMGITLEKYYELYPEELL